MTGKRTGKTVGLMRLGGVSVTGESRDTKFLIRKVTIRGDIAGRLRERRGLG